MISWVGVGVGAGADGPSQNRERGRLPRGVGHSRAELASATTSPVLCLSEMFFSMAPMTSSVSSVRSVSELSDVDLDSSTHSDFCANRLQAPAFAPGVRAPGIQHMEGGGACRDLHGAVSQSPALATVLGHV